MIQISNLSKTLGLTDSESVTPDPQSTDWKSVLLLRDLHLFNKYEICQSGGDKSQICHFLNLGVTNLESVEK